MRCFYILVGPKQQPDRIMIEKFKYNLPSPSKYFLGYVTGDLFWCIPIRYSLKSLAAVTEYVNEITGRSAEIIYNSTYKYYYFYFFLYFPETTLEGKNVFNRGVPDDTRSFPSRPPCHPAERTLGKKKNKNKEKKKRKLSKSIFSRLPYCGWPSYYNNSQYIGWYNSTGTPRAMTFRNIIFIRKYIPNVYN